MTTVKHRIITAICLLLMAGWTALVSMRTVPVSAQDATSADTESTSPADLAKRGLVPSSDAQPAQPAADNAEHATDANPALVSQSLDKSRLADCELHVIGIYSPKHHGKDDRVFVEIKPTGKPIVVALTSYFGTQWNLKIDPEANVRQLIVAGYFEQVLAEQPDGIPVSIHSYFPGMDRNRKDYFWAYSWHSTEGRNVRRKLQELTGLQPTTFQGEYDGLRFVVDGREGDVAQYDSEPVASKPAAAQAGDLAEMAQALNEKAAEARKKGRIDEARKLDDQLLYLLLTVRLQRDDMEELLRELRAKAEKLDNESRFAEKKGVQSQIIRLMDSLALEDNFASVFERQATSRQQRAKKQLRVYRMQIPNLHVVVPMIEVLMPGAVINEDEKGKGIHVLATASQHRDVEQLFRSLSGAAEEPQYAQMAGSPLASSKPNLTVRIDQFSRTWVDGSMVTLDAIADRVRDGFRIRIESAHATPYTHIVVFMDYLRVKFKSLSYTFVAVEPWYDPGDFNLATADRSFFLPPVGPIPMFARPNATAGAAQAMPNSAPSVKGYLQLELMKTELELEGLAAEVGQDHPRAKAARQRNQLLRKKLDQFLQDEASELWTRIEQDHAGSFSVGQTGSNTVSGFRPAVSRPQLEAKRKSMETTYRHAEHSAAEVAGRYRAEAAQQTPDANTLKMLKDHLQVEVMKAWEAQTMLQRYRLQLAELDLETVRARQKRRGELSAKIIARRVEDLLAGEDLSWKSAAAKSTGSRKTADASSRRVRVVVPVDASYFKSEDLDLNSDVSLMGFGRATDAKGQSVMAHLALAHDCTIVGVIGHETKPGITEVSLLVDSDGVQTVTQESIDRMLDDGYRFWLDHIEGFDSTSAMRALEQSDIASATSSDGGENAVAPESVTRPVSAGIDGVSEE